MAGRDCRRVAWDRALAAYHAARIIMEASESFGPQFEQSEEWGRERARLESEYGSYENAKAHPEGKLLAAAAWDKSQAADEAAAERFFQPLWTAANQVAVTPAPDMAALRIKLDIITREEVWNDPYFTGDAFKMVEAEARALLAEVMV